MRLFCGFSLPNPIVEELQSFQTKHKHLKGIKWVKPEQWHITLCFMGEMSEDRLPEIKSVLKKSTELFPFPNFTLEKLDFSPGDKPYMIWAYFKTDKSLGEWSAYIRKSLQLEMPGRSELIPHITLGSFKKPSYYFQLEKKENSIEAFSPNDLHLWESKLGKYYLLNY